jgi:hypothetical protein
MNLTAATLRPIQIRALQIEAVENGDRELDAVCECALVGDIEAIDMVCAAINFGADDPSTYGSGRG